MDDNENRSEVRLFWYHAFTGVRMGSCRHASQHVVYHSWYTAAIPHNDLLCCALPHHTIRSPMPTRSCKSQLDSDGDMAGGTDPAPTQDTHPHYCLEQPGELEG